METLEKRKLTLKDLAPYLPFGLKCIVGKEKVLLVGLDSITEYWIIWKKLASSNQGCSYPSKNFKPILHPLSDLTRQIEHNGEKFTPDWKLQHIGDKMYEGFPYEVLKGRYCDVQKLLEWHFDIFGLIDKDLARDVNTLDKNPYK